MHAVKIDPITNTDLPNFRNNYCLPSYKTPIQFKTDTQY